MEQRKFTFSIMGTKNPNYVEISVNEIPDIYCTFKRHEYQDGQFVHRPKIKPYAVTDDVIDDAVSGMLDWCRTYHNETMLDCGGSEHNATEFFREHGGEQMSYEFFKEKERAMMLDGMFSRVELIDLIDYLTTIGYKMIVSRRDFFKGYDFIFDADGSSCILEDKKKGIIVSFELSRYNETAKIKHHDYISQGFSAEDAARNIAHDNMMMSEWLHCYRYNYLFNEVVHWSRQISNNVVSVENFLGLDAAAMDYRLGARKSGQRKQIEKGTYHVLTAGCFFDILNAVGMIAEFVPIDYMDQFDE
jgi:hypothetical protein